MIIRRLLASFLVLVFIVASVPNFFIYALSKTFLDTDFYKRDDLQTGVYDFAIDKTVDVMQENSEMMKGYFTEADLKTDIQSVFSKKVFAEIINDFAGQLEKYKENPETKLVLSLKLLRENLLTVSNNLAYKIYQRLPTCSDDITLNQLRSNSVPACAPKNLSYEDVVQPITDNFENTIYTNIPEEMSNLDKVVPLQALVQAESYRNWSFIILIVILVLIVLVIFSNTSVTVGYIATAFFFSGAGGYLIGSSFSNLLDNAKTQIGDARAQQFIYFLLNFISEEVKHLSLMFLIVGVALYVIKFILKRTVDQKNVPVQQ